MKTRDAVTRSPTALVAGVVILLVLLLVYVAATLRMTPSSERTGAGLHRQIRYGHLGSKFFSPFEIQDFGLEIDLNNVPYRADIALAELKLGCPVRDCLASIDEPHFSAAEVDWLFHDDLILGVELDDVVKAYPVKILNWHEVVNDTLAGTPMVITYCPLCGSGLVFERPRVEGRVLEFGVSGRLYFSDLVLYDRQTGTLWSQLEGKPIAGPEVEKMTTLQRVRADLVPWEIWRGIHPDTLVLQRPTRASPVGGQPARDPSDRETFLKPYDQNPYPYYKVNDYFLMTKAFADERLRSKSVVLGLALGDWAKAYVEDAIRANIILNDRIGEVPVLVFAPPDGPARFFSRVPEGSQAPLTFAWTDERLTDLQTGSRWDSNGVAVSGALKGKRLEMLTVTPSYWFAWSIFHPGTETFPAQLGDEYLPGDH